MCQIYEHKEQIEMYYINENNVANENIIKILI